MRREKGIYILKEKENKKFEGIIIYMMYASRSMEAYEGYYDINGSYKLKRLASSKLTYNLAQLIDWINELKSKEIFKERIPVVAVFEELAIIYGL